jgi:soluble lytic murein transglycosylase-like protein
MVNNSAFGPLLLALAFASGSASATIYRYVDDSGTLKYTDQRPVGKRYLAFELREQQPAPAARADTRGTARSRSPVPPTAKFLVFKDTTRALYAEHIRAAARANKLEPALVHAVISAESAYNPYAVSRAGAVGLMQLMPQTAERYSVANRLDPVDNIQGGTRYLSDLLKMFNNDLALAIAAYNAGEQNVMKYGNRIPPFKETRAYVPKVLAFYRQYRAAPQQI